MSCGDRSTLREKPFHFRARAQENDPAAAFKTARAAQKASLCTRTFPEMTANWFYGQILYANRDVPKRVLR